MCTLVGTNNLPLARRNCFYVRGETIPTSRGNRSILALREGSTSNGSASSRTLVRDSRRIVKNTPTFCRARGPVAIDPSLARMRALERMTDGLGTSQTTHRAPRVTAWRSSCGCSVQSDEANRSMQLERPRSPTAEVHERERSPSRRGIVRFEERFLHADRKLVSSRGFRDVRFHPVRPSVSEGNP